MLSDRVDDVLGSKGASNEIGRITRQETHEDEDHRGYAQDLWDQENESPEYVAPRSHLSP